MHSFGTLGFEARLEVRLEVWWGLRYTRLASVMPENPNPKSALFITRGDQLP